MRQGDAIVLRLQLLRNQQVVFGLEEVGTTVNRELEVVTVGDRVFRTCLDAEAEGDAAAVVDVVNGSVTFVGSDALGWRTRIVGGDDVNTLGRTCCGAEITRDALFGP